MILTEIGEIGAHVGGKTFVLRPSLYAMSQLGEPGQIVELYAQVMTEGLQGREARDQFGNALAVLFACSEEDLSGVFGCFTEPNKYRPGLASIDHIIPLARCLLRHGVTGANPPLPRRHDDEPEYVQGFVARDHVATAMAHLGVSEHEAWRMTMTGLVAALRAKFPPNDSQAPGARAPTKEQHEATEAWFDAIDAKRKGGAH